MKALHRLLWAQDDRLEAYRCVAGLLVCLVALAIVVFEVFR